jgi:hypothetical protein
MKLLASFLLGLITPLAIAQTTLIVDHNFNAPTGPHIYSTLQAAADAANPGDTIQVQPSPTAYGNISIDKPLVLVGIGFNVVKDIAFESVIGQITLTNNADNTTQASGTTIKGLRITSGIWTSLSGASFTLSNITVYNCILSYIYNVYMNLDNWEVYDCYMTSNISSSSCFYTSYEITNSLFRNNLLMYNINFASTSPGSNTITNNLLFGGVNIRAEGTNTNIINNVFVGAANTTAGFASYLRDCIVSYNIFYGVTPSIAAAGSTSDNFQRNVFTYNLLYSTGDDLWPPTGGGGGNTGSPNYIGSPLFANVSLLNSWSSAYDFTLDPSSPALLANIPDAGALFDIGITGGAYPWTETNMTFQPTALPVIEILNTSTIINPGDNLPVHVKATSN